MATSAGVGILGALRIVVDADTSKAQATLRKFGGQAGMIGTALGGAMGMAGIAALRVGDEYKDAMDSIRIGTGATGDTLRGLEDEFKAVAGRVPDDIGTVAKTLADLNTRTGLTGDRLGDLSESILDLSRLMNMDASTAVANITRLYGDWGVATEDYVATNDKLLRVAQATGISIDEMTARVVEFGAPMRAMGLSLEEGIALFGKWEKEGVNSTTILSGLKLAIGNWGKAGIKADEGLQQLIEDLKNADEATGFLMAKQIVGARAANDFYRAVVEGRFDLQEYVDVANSAGDTVQGLADETRDFGDAFREVMNRVKVAIGPVTDSFAGIAESMGNAIFLLPAMAGALGNVLGRLWTKAGMSGAIKKAMMLSGALAGKVFALAMTTSQQVASVLMQGWGKLGALAGGRFGLLFKFAAVAAIAALWLEVWNQFQAFQAKVAGAQADLSAKVASISEQTTEQVLANWRNTSDKLASLGGWDRALADSFAGKQSLDALENFGKTLLADTTLTADQIADGLRLMSEAVDHAQARGNDDMAARFGDMANLLRMREPYVAARTGMALVGDIMTRGALAVGAGVNKVLANLDMASPIRESFHVATAAIAEGFGAIKAALKKGGGPQLIGKDDRLANMEGRMKKVMANIKKAVAAEDPMSISYWEKARAKQQLQIDRLKGRTVPKLKDIKSAYAETGADVARKWEDVRVKTIASADRATDGVVDAAGEALAGIDALDGFGSGYSYMDEIAGGIDAGIPNVAAAANRAAAAVAGPTQSGSPPKEGPLKNIDKWGGPLVDAWLGGIEQSIGRVSRTGARLAGALAPNPHLGPVAIATAGGGLAAGGVGGRAVHIHIGTLIADDKGLDELERRMSRRKGMRSRGPMRYQQTS